MDVSAASVASAVAPQNFEAAPDTLDAVNATGPQDQGALAQEQDSASGNSTSSLKERLSGLDVSVGITAQIQEQTAAQTAQAQPQAQTTAQPAQQTTGTIGPDQGYLASLEGIAQSGQSLGDKLKMAWDTTQYYWRNAGTAQGTPQTIGGGMEVDAYGCVGTQGGPKVCVGPAAIEEGVATSLIPAAERIAGRILAPEAEKAGAAVSETGAQAVGASSKIAQAEGTAAEQFVLTENRAAKIFGTRAGHILDTPANRELITNVANNPAAKLGTDKFGTVWSGQIQADGTQVWVQTRNGQIVNAGVNATPHAFNPNTGLAAPVRPGWK